MTEEYPKTYKIEKGIPIPKRTGRESAFRHLRDHMEIGDSIVIHSLKEYRAFFVYFGRQSKKIACRKIGKNQFRVWRTK